MCSERDLLRMNVWRSIYHDAAKGDNMYGANVAAEAAVRDFDKAFTTKRANVDSGYLQILVNVVIEHDLLIINREERDALNSVVAALDAAV